MGHWEGDHWVEGHLGKSHPHEKQLSGESFFSIVFFLFHTTLCGSTLLSKSPILRLSSCSPNPAIQPNIVQWLITTAIPHECQWPKLGADCVCFNGLDAYRKSFCHKFYSMNICKKNYYKFYFRVKLIKKKK